jgi:hypothetical protein
MSVRRHTRWKPSDLFRKAARIQSVSSILGYASLASLPILFTLSWVKVPLNPIFWFVPFFILTSVRPYERMLRRRALDKAATTQANDLFVASISLERGKVPLGSDTGLLWIEDGLLKFDGGELEMAFSSAGWTEQEGTEEYMYNSVEPPISMTIKPHTLFRSTKYELWSFSMHAADWLEGNPTAAYEDLPPLEVNPRLLVTERQRKLLSYLPAIAFLPLAAIHLLMPSDLSMVQFSAAAWLFFWIITMVELRNKTKLMRAQAELSRDAERLACAKMPIASSASLEESSVYGRSG